jgi:hypothetical protein
MRNVADKSPRENLDFMCDCHHGKVSAIDFWRRTRTAAETAVWELGTGEKHPQTSLQCFWKCCSRQKFRCRWVTRLTASETGKPQLHGLPRSGRPVTAVSAEIVRCADAIVREDRCITTRQLVLSL